MTHTYNIAGMTCNGCAAKVKDTLLRIGDITNADVQLQAPQAAITMQKHIPVHTLQTTLQQAGNFTITEADRGMHQHETAEETRSWLATYKPILLVFAYITGTTLLVEVIRQNFTWQLWLQNFMAAFFLVFSFFKLLDIKGFAESYSSYDLIAKRWMRWGYVYAFLELALGVAYLLRFDPLLTNSITLIVLTVSIAGVLKSVLNKRKIKCACLGTVFNLPMTTVTIVEDALMIILSIVMIIMTQ